jgi:hypothetical protein
MTMSRFWQLRLDCGNLVFIVQKYCLDCGNYFRFFLVRFDYGNESDVSIVIIMFEL